MSRYEWPGGDAGRASPDQLTSRREWLGQRFGVVPEETLLAARVGRAAATAPARKVRGRQPKDHPSGRGLLWLPIGPATVLAGQAEGAPRVSGRVRDLQVSPDGQRAYAATANGGIWYTDDAGASWIQVGGWATRRIAAAAGEGAGGAEGLTFGSLLVHFGANGDGAGDEVFAATGEAGARDDDHFGGVGVLHALHPVPTVVADETADPWTVEGGGVVTGRGSYRLAVDPATPLGMPTPAHLLLGTSNGLFERTNVGGTPTWAAIINTPFGATTNPRKPVRVTDLRWLPKAAGTSRVWAAVDDRSKNGTGSGLWWADVTAAGIGTWHPVALANVTYGARIGLADSSAAPGILFALSVVGDWDTAVPAMWRIDDTGAAPVVAVIGNVPGRLFKSTGVGVGQVNYDLTLVADPAVPNQLIIGGAALEVTSNDWNAALWLVQVQPGGPSGFRLSFTPVAGPPPPPPPPAVAPALPAVQTYNGAADPTFIGAGVHADVHCAVWTTGQAVGSRQVWIGCDGGVYRSAAEGSLRTFLSRNTGMGSLQPDWVSSNPNDPYDVIVGTQDNGTLRRAGDSLWRVVFLGDGGGLTFYTDPNNQFVAQYVQANWQDSGGRAWPLVFRGGNTADQTAESGAASFYSGCAATVDAGVTRVAIGTTRVWCTQDGGQTFFTLPGGLDPKRSPGPNPADTVTDSCVLVSGAASPDGQVITLRWANPRRLLVLCKRAVLVHDLVGGTALAAPTSTVRRIDGSGASGKKGFSPGTLPPVGSWTDIAAANPIADGTATDGTLYVTTTGPEQPSTSPDDDTLWWYDGSSNWKKTGLRSSGLGSTPTGTVAPAYAVAVDPDHPTTVYVGTGAGVWQGLRAGTPSAPTWTWAPLVNGLPEATVTDLEIVRRPVPGGTVRLLRATVVSAGVWELDLSGTTASELFLRVFDTDLRRGLPTVLSDTSTLPATVTRFDASPDLRVRNAPGTTVPPRSAATLRMSGQPSGTTVDQRLALHELWVLQTALHSHDPLVRPTGQWTPEFVARLLAAGCPTTAPGQPRMTAAFYTAQLAAGTPYASPWDTPTPSEADLTELVVDRPVPTGGAATGLVRGAAKVDVLVHRRSAPDPTAEVPWVLLIRRQVTGGSAAWAALPVPWAAAVTAAVSTGVAPAAALGDGWQVAGSGPAMLQPSSQLTARRPQAVTFDATFAAAPAGSQWLLVAIVGSAGDPPVIPAGNLQAAILGSRHLACRSLRLR